MKKITKIYLGKLHLKLHMLCEAPLYSPIKAAIISLQYFFIRYLPSNFFHKCSRYLPFRVILSDPFLRDPFSFPES